jgi:hypothetical protein
MMLSKVRALREAYNEVSHKLWEGNLADEIISYYIPVCRHLDLSDEADFCSYVKEANAVALAIKSSKSRDITEYRSEVIRYAVGKMGQRVTRLQAVSLTNLIGMIEDRMNSPIPFPGAVIYRSMFGYKCGETLDIRSNFMVLKAIKGQIGRSGCNEVYLAYIHHMVDYLEASALQRAEVMAAFDEVYVEGGQFMDQYVVCMILAFAQHFGKDIGLIKRYLAPEILAAMDINAHWMPYCIDVYVQAANTVRRPVPIVVIRWVAVLVQPKYEEALKNPSKHLITLLQKLFANGYGWSDTLELNEDGTCSSAKAILISAMHKAMVHPDYAYSVY